MSSADEFEFRQAVEEDGADLTSDEALVLFAALDFARTRLAKLEAAIQAEADRLPPAHDLTEFGRGAASMLERVRRTQREE